GYLSAQTSCSVPANVTNTGKTLWSSENGSQDYNDGAKPLARGINRVYLDGKMTAYLNWDLIAAVTPHIPWPTVGLMLANQPWSGAYSVGKDVWATNLNSNNSADFFVHSNDITPSGGAYSLTVQPGYLYTITTTTGQGKGTATSPPQGSLNL